MNKFNELYESMVNEAKPTNNKSIMKDLKELDKVSKLLSKVQDITNNMIIKYDLAGDIRSFEDEERLSQAQELISNLLD